MTSKLQMEINNSNIRHDNIMVMPHTYGGHLWERDKKENIIIRVFVRHSKLTIAEEWFSAAGGHPTNVKGVFIVSRQIKRIILLVAFILHKMSITLVYPCFILDNLEQVKSPRIYFTLTTKSVFIQLFEKRKLMKSVSTHVCVMSIDVCLLISEGSYMMSVMLFIVLRDSLIIWLCLKDILIELN
ncbi:hypothetical protein QTP88_019007 [Uroleucon formosanum]